MSDSIQIFITEDNTAVKVYNPVVVDNVKIFYENIVETSINSDSVIGETPAGILDGSNTTFTTEFNFIPGKLSIYLNGLLQKKVLHYNTTGTQTIIFNDSPQPIDLIEVDYVKQ